MSSPNAKSESSKKSLFTRCRRIGLSRNINKTPIVGKPASAVSGTPPIPVDDNSVGVQTPHKCIGTSKFGIKASKASKKPLIRIVLENQMRLKNKDVEMDPQLKSIMEPERKGDKSNSAKVSDRKVLRLKNKDAPAEVDPLNMSFMEPERTGDKPSLEKIMEFTDLNILRLKKKAAFDVEPLHKSFMEPERKRNKPNLAKVSDRKVLSLKNKDAPVEVDPLNMSFMEPERKGDEPNLAKVIEISDHKILEEPVGEPIRHKRKLQESETNPVEKKNLETKKENLVKKHCTVQLDIEKKPSDLVSVSKVSGGNKSNPNTKKKGDKPNLTKIEHKMLENPVEEPNRNKRKLQESETNPVDKESGGQVETKKENLVMEHCTVQLDIEKKPSDLVSVSKVTALGLNKSTINAKKPRDRELKKLMKRLSMNKSISTGSDALNEDKVTISKPSGSNSQVEVCDDEVVVKAKRRRIVVSSSEDENCEGFQSSDKRVEEDYLQHQVQELSNEINQKSLHLH